jgi:hypothetical protein
MINHKTKTVVKREIKISEPNPWVGGLKVKKNS